MAALKFEISDIVYSVPVRSELLTDETCGEANLRSTKLG